MVFIYKEGKYCETLPYKSLFKNQNKTHSHSQIHVILTASQLANFAHHFPS